MQIRKLLAEKPQRALTIKVITDTGANTRNLVISRKRVRLVQAGVVGTALLFVLGVIGIVDAIRGHAEIARLEGRIAELEKENASIVELREQLAEIWIIHTRLQKMLGAGDETADAPMSSRALPWGIPLAPVDGSAPVLQAAGRPEQGIAFAGPPGALVVATAPGIVRASRWDATHGEVLVVDHGHGIQTRYARDVVAFVTPGDRVGQGRPVGVIRQIGARRAPVLLYQVVVDGRTVNPLAAMLPLSSAPDGMIASMAPAKR